MIRNYLTSAFRNIRRHPFISFINIFGLTVGLTCCFLIVTYVVNEKSYDRSYKNADDIYRVTRIFYSGANTETLHLSAVAPAFGPRLISAFPDIREMTRTVNGVFSSFRYREKLFNEQHVFCADSNFFDFFTVPVLKGDARKALAEPYSVMLTPEIARKYFGDEDPMNKEIILDNTKHAFKVAGIFSPLPVNSHMHPDILVSFTTLNDPTIYGENNLATDFGGNAFYTYLMFPKNYNVGRVRSQLPGFLDKYCQAIGPPANLKVHNMTSLTLQKLTDIHLTSHLDDEIEENGDITRVYIFSAIALFILLIACINYMNLSTARSALRAKEIGVRKVVGAQRKELIAQFLSESVLITYLSLVMAFGLTSFLLPAVSRMSGLELSINTLLSWPVLTPVLLLPVIIGLISGMYPAVFMSSFIPVKVLKGIFKVQTSRFSFRRALVVLQFSISIVLIVATIVVFKQLQYINNKDLGLDKDHVMIMRYDGWLNKQFYAFKNDLLRDPNIKDIAQASRIPSGRLLDYQDASVLAGSSFQPTKVDIKELGVDEGFIPTFGIKMAAGRNFSKDIKTDSNKWILNEAAVKMLGWKTPGDAVNREIKYDSVIGYVIGVTKDYHFESLHEAVAPMILRYGHRPYYLAMKISGQNVQSTVNLVRETWQRYLPTTPFDFTFLDQHFEQLYRSERQQGTLFTIFACIAIFIACLGLLGLSAFTISQRVKEIGVRKVLGASVPQIVRELSKEFLLLVTIAAIIALPAAFWLMQQWLRGFASRTGISWWILPSAGIVAVIIAFGTISFQSIKAANANPVRSLRSE